MNTQTTTTPNTHLNDKLLKVSDDVNEVRHMIGLLSDLSCAGQPGSTVQINTDYLATTFGRLTDMLFDIEEFIKEKSSDNDKPVQATENNFAKFTTKQ